MTTAAKRIKDARQAVEAGLITPAEFDKVLREAGGKSDRSAKDWWFPEVILA